MWVLPRPRFWKFGSSHDNGRKGSRRCLDAPDDVLRGEIEGSREQGSINMLDSANYRAIKVPQEDGSQIDGIAYFAPAAEHDHLAPGLARAQERMQEVMLRNQLAEALEDPGKSTAALIDQGVSLARRAQEAGIEQPDFDHSLKIAAALLWRDGNAKQRKAHARWARKQCTTATRGSEDPVHRFRTGLRFNPMGPCHAAQQGETRRARALGACCTRRSRRSARLCGGA